MSFVLSQENVIQHLIQRKVCESEAEVIQVQPKLAKNFNLLITLTDRQHLLVKQEPYRPDSHLKGDLHHEKQLHHLLQRPKWVEITQLTSEMVDFDAASGVAVFRYLSDYCDLSQFYQETTEYPVQIAAVLGKTLARIHTATIDSDDQMNNDQIEETLCCESLELTDSEDPEEHASEAIAPHLEDQGILTPECFGKISTAGLKFYQLYQRFEKLGQAIAQLNESLQSCCLTHSDLKLNNILLHHNWQNLDENNPPDPAIRLIDWEKWQWGDPAQDLGALVASYLKLWLQSLLVSAGLDIEQSLRFAERPLEALQPSMVALVGSYLQTFPEIGDRVPNFVERVMQFAGLSLIENIRADLYYYESFGNQEICMLQVAKSLLCEPVSACQTLLGSVEAIQQWQNQPGVFSVPDQSKSQESESQALASPPIQPSPFISSQPIPLLISQQSRYSIATVLTNLIENLQIHSTTHIQHQGYEPLLLSEAVAPTTPCELPSWHRQYLICQLGQYLARIYWSGEQVKLTQAELTQAELTQADSEQNHEVTHLKNDQYRGIPLDFYNRLHAANQGDGYDDPDWQIQTQDYQGWLVQKQGLTVLIPFSSETHGKNYKIGDRISIHLPKNRIDDRYYVAVGNAGMIEAIDLDRSPKEKPPTLQICFNITAEGAIRAMQHFSQALNSRQIPFAFKVRFDPTEYDRWDTAILEITRAHYSQIKPLVQKFYQCAPTVLRQSVPFLMKPLGAGIGLAEQPPQGCFRVHRYQLLAEALFNAWEQKITTLEGKIQIIQNAFQQQGIDWQQPYCKSESLDWV
jgi:HopA1 effector protein family/Phosphotransferase enzyme family